MSLSDLIRQGVARSPAPTVAKVARVAVATAPANDTDNLAALLAAHSDGSAGGVDWSAWRLTAATSSPAWAVVNPRGLTLLLTVEAIPKPRSYAQAWPVERIVPWPDIEDDTDDLLAVPQAQEAAQSAIQRAAAPCWQCRHLHTATTATDSVPRCDRGHRLVYRTTATRTWPSRSDARDCGDRA